MDRRQFLFSTTVLGLAAASGRGLAADSEPLALRLNQIGFLPRSRKRFALPISAGASAQGFEILSESGHVVFTGTMAPERFDLGATTGEIVRTGDFSAFHRKGLYRLRAGPTVSHPCHIDDRVYTPLLHDAARCFHLIRANTDIDDATTGIKVAAGHLSERSLMVAGQARDLTGGWYNAGDFGKYTHMAALSVSHMLRLYELRPATAGLTLDIPALYPEPLPDLLQLARWGLEWLLKMQNDDGSVLHKVDSQPALTWGYWPVDDPNPRKAMAASSIDAGVFTGVMVHAGRVFAHIHPVFSQRCTSAARKAWAWLSQHPDLAHTDAYYLDPDARQEIVWAMCEMALLDEAGQIDLPDIGVTPFYWPSPQVLGMMSLALKGHAGARSQILAGAKSIGDHVRKDPYGFSTLPESYAWGSNEAALNVAAICLYADHLQPEAGFRDTAQSLFDYILGCNTLDHCFVTGHGTRPTQHPFHWIYNMQKIAMPGWASGGANGQASGADSLLARIIAAGTPPARCFVDAGQNEGSYASNEGETSENAALLFVAGMLNS